MTRTALPERMTFLMIVNDPGIARFAHDSGVARLFVDLEYIGKDLRQKGLDTWKSRQTVEDISRIREAVPEGHLLVRVNPLHDGTKAELDEVLARGADSVMLPMFHSRDDLARFLDLLADRAEPVPLVETAAALAAVPHICETLSLSRLHIGLNDLHLDMKLDFMFQPLADGLLDEAAEALNTHGVRFGIGGIARAGEGIVSPEYLLGEHVRLGSDAAILSRTLHRGAPDLQSLRAEMDFPAELAKLQAIYAGFRTADAETLGRNRIETADRIRDVVTLIRNKRTV
ncbi:aldolase/citrate lyase family protein [Roseovarius sp. ZX-A-9]|uniref:aldolase/citrate lyase family protein n=1 Tax=Roseovarius sp. ZX-A-9 TaxID=3014783 RepID=UPI00232F7BF5|nr:aldolase/citrate lyase family protein [Roseovarius sp. ZX-A-9]